MVVHTSHAHGKKRKLNYGLFIGILLLIVVAVVLGYSSRQEESSRQVPQQFQEQEQQPSEISFPSTPILHPTKLAKVISVNILSADYSFSDSSAKTAACSTCSVDRNSCKGRIPFSYLLVLENTQQANCFYRTSDKSDLIADVNIGNGFGYSGVNNAESFTLAGDYENPTNFQVCCYLIDRRESACDTEIIESVCR